jgi:hypothetical protein
MTPLWPADDLDVSMRMAVVAGGRQHGVVVIDQQQAVVGVVGVVMLAERERVP